MALRSFPGRRRLAVTVACLFMLAAHAAPAIARSNGWTLTRTPSAVTDSIASDISLTATNSNGGSSVGCVRLQIPSAFTVNLVAVDGASGSHVWTANPPASGGGGSTIVVVRAINNANRLTSNGESVTFHINVTGTPVGIYTWNGTSFNDAGCGSGADNGSVVVMVVPGGPPSNTPAAANDDGPYSVLAGVDLDVGGNAGVLANDTDADNDTLSAVADTSPAHGSLILGSDGGFTYSPDAGYTGPDSFTYRAFDGTANSAPATVTLTVTNSAPVAAVDAYTTPKNTPLVVAAGAGVIANDSDPDAGQTLTVSVAAGPAHGTLALNANGSFTYTPTSGYDGADGFTYSLSDGTATDSAAVGLTVVNGAPTATDDLYSGFKNIPLLIGGGSGLLANDSDPDGDGLTAAVVSPPSNGLLLLGANGGFTYTPALGFTGTDSFTYRASDGTDPSATATVVLAISNNAPVAADDVGAVSHDRTLVVNTASGVLANDTDVNGDSLVVSLVTGPAHGTLSLGPSGSFTYMPGAGYVGPDAFTYRADDGAATSNVATVSLSVTNAAPTAVGEAFGVSKNNTLQVPSGTLTANDTDGDGDSLATALVASPAHGGVTVYPNGSFAYAPDAGFVGSDSFTYRVTDGIATSTTTTVTLLVANDSPIATDDHAATTRNATLTVAASGGVLVNDTDANGDALSAILVSGPTHGALTLNANGSFTYMPTPGYLGGDAFTYRAWDGSASSTDATVAISVINRPPSATGDARGVTHDRIRIVAAPGVLANDTDPDGDPLTASLVSGPTHGSLSLDPDGSFTYDPDAGYVGNDSFVYNSSDGLAADAATVTLTVTNAKPVAATSSHTVAHDTVLTVAAPGVLSGATDGDGDGLVAIVASGTSHGVLVLATDGSFTYEPAAGYIGRDAFTIQVTDGISTSAPKNVTIVVTAPAPPPPPPPPPPQPTPAPTAPSPTPSPSPPLPTASSIATAAPSVESTPTPLPASSPGPTVGPSAGAAGHFTVGAPTSGGGSAVDGVDLSAMSTNLAGFGGLLTWAVPSLVMSVPGLLIVLVMLAQIGGAAAWLPIVRRTLGAFGVGRRGARAAGRA